jgi:hypothetical protein
MDRARLAVAPVLGLVAALALLPGTRALDEVTREGQLGPGFWPRVVLIGLALACVAKVVETWRARPAARDDDAERPAISWPRLAVAVALVLGYVLLTPLLGFALTTIPFVGAFMWLCGARSAVSLAANALGGTVALLYLFVKVVYLPLPKGTGPFETVTLALYRALRLF